MEILANNNVNKSTLNYVYNKKIYYKLLRNINKAAHIIISNTKDQADIYYINKQITESIKYILINKNKE